jgi:hypothetical protein
MAVAAVRAPASPHAEEFFSDCERFANIRLHRKRTGQPDKMLAEANSTLVP